MFSTILAMYRRSPPCFRVRARQALAHPNGHFAHLGAHVHAEEDGFVERLVEEAAAGDAAAWNALVRAYGRLVWAVALREVHSPRDAADVSQTTWLRLVEHIDRLNDPARVGAWLATTARREGRRVAAKARRMAPTEDERLHAHVDGERARLVNGTPDVESTLLRSETAAAVDKAIARLGDRDQRLLRLLMQEPALPYSTISGALHMPIGSIGPTRARCLAKLRVFLADALA